MPNNSAQFSLEDPFMLYKTVSNPFTDLCYLFIVALCLSDVALVNAQRRPTPPPCLPNHAIPPGYQTCRDTDGRVLVGPPPARLGTRVGPPPAAGSDQTPFSTKSQSQSPEEHSVWFNVGVIAAITALIAAIAQLIRSLRKG
jgi:hypothetical protein